MINVCVEWIFGRLYLPGYIEPHIIYTATENEPIKMAKTKLKCTHTHTNTWSILFIAYSALMVGKAENPFLLSKCLQTFAQFSTCITCARHTCTLTQAYFFFKAFGSVSFNTFFVDYFLPSFTFLLCWFCWRCLQLLWLRYFLILNVLPSIVMLLFLPFRAMQSQGIVRLLSQHVVLNYVLHKMSMWLMLSMLSSFALLLFSSLSLSRT